jgi:hypothetical protein
MTITAATLAALYKPCANAACGQPVHRNSKACKHCGAPPPWLAAQAEAQSRVAAPPAEPTPAPAVLKQQPLVIPQNVEFAESTASNLKFAESTASNLTIVKLPPPAFEPHVVMKDFSFLFGDVFGAFKKGQVLYDFQTITKLKTANQPIAPASEVDGLVCCPCGCNHMFLIPERARGKVA